MTQANRQPSRSLLSPLGQYRSQSIVPSRGKREKKRKKRENRPPKEPQQKGMESNATGSEIAQPPDMLKYLTIGFNSTTRYLESLARTAYPEVTQDQDPTTSKAETAEPTPSSPANPKPMIAIFVPRLDQPPILYSHLPLLIKTASLASTSSPPPRLISLPKGAEERLSAALSIPRAGLIGLIEGAPNINHFIEFIRQQVPEVEVPWLHEAVAGSYMPVNIKAIETNVPAYQKKAKLSHASSVIEHD